MAVAPAVDELCRKYSVRGVEAAHIATAPILGYYQYDRLGLNENAFAFSESVVKFIAQKHIKNVIIAARWSHYKHPDVINVKLAATVQTLMASGANVYVLKDVPQAGFEVPRHAILTVLRHGDLSKLGISPDKYAADNHDYEPIFDHLSQMGATILDTPKCFLNAAGYYDVVRNNKLLYHDSDHLTVEGAKLLFPVFEPLFRTP
jgi:hypothetical protein